MNPAWIYFHQATIKMSPSSLKNFRLCEVEKREGILVRAAGTAQCVQTPKVLNDPTEVAGLR
jgi:hypothetical protein